MMFSVSDHVDGNPTRQEVLDHFHDFFTVCVSSQFADRIKIVSVEPDDDDLWTAVCKGRISKTDAATIGATLEG